MAIEKSIDTSTIEGYADMTAEEKVAALEAFKYNDVSDELAAVNDKIGRYKRATTKANHEVATFKKQLRALQNGEVKPEDVDIEEDETPTPVENNVENPEIAELKAQLAALQKKNNISEYKAQFISQGYSDDLAEKAATALVDNDMATVFEANKTLMVEHDKALKAGNLLKTPKPQLGGKGPGAEDVMTKAKFLKLSTKDQIAYKNEHPNWKEELK